MRWTHHVFNETADWVTQLSWMKFIMFAILMLIAGGIMQEMLFTSNNEVVVVNKKKPTKQQRMDAGDTRVFDDGDTSVSIDHNGIRIHKSKSKHILPAPPAPEIPPKPPVPVAGAEPAAEPKAPISPMPPAEPAVTTTPGGEIRISLPPEIGKEVRDAIDEAVDDAAEQKVASYRKESSTWFTNFVMLAVIGLFGIKALMGGKKRAELRATTANATAEREALQRQVSEAKMQMMQAQVEPHFLFNTLASVEHLIETDPPRAAAMQRSLILYLRAVLPQIRETMVITNLGREADMVKAYLELLKMRMEERLQVDFHVPDGLRSAAFPPMMLQSLVENAIKHGLECKPEGGTIRVSAEVAHNKLRVTVSDDGMGFGTVKSDGTGTGLQNIRERLKLLHKDTGYLTIVPNTPDGVSATIEVPYQLAN